ncbi:spore coat protein [Ethanoligenens harbinense]|uniref:Coat F domain-containing protein n=1 Tax=Ethanoligenens harbinense (strain DSM 18485 / JCM 12961 / CGMCC 1.5033 / YUAN-3) TaxID=663278 RepID=E6U4K3_ETHHY|nr:spore coat protein [Ethanoligenens harbinense]ADU26631.1 coat F domain-containing protein [Ethanoligenens harbinense YUAN-3]AVQ95753.1 spore coat protein [Ethanoligenens harbinense YUAN-3]AYF38416.1 spore coat protein [Ethanoligenens harbinense]AYF41159.1 spore coat protein [Ethanoligenens harbinense]
MPFGNNTKNQWGDKEILYDAVITQKAMADAYDTSAAESITPNLRNEFLGLMKDEQEILFELYTEMQKRSWLPVQMADQAQVTSARQKYQPANP